MGDAYYDGTDLLQDRTLGRYLTNVSIFDKLEATRLGFRASRYLRCDDVDLWNETIVLKEVGGKKEKW